MQSGIKQMSSCSAWLCWAEEDFTQIESQRLTESFLSIQMSYACEETIQVWGKNYPKTQREQWPEIIEGGEEWESHCPV